MYAVRQRARRFGIAQQAEGAQRKPGLALGRGLIDLGPLALSLGVPRVAMALAAMALSAMQLSEVAPVIIDPTLVARNNPPGDNCANPV